MDFIDAKKVSPVGHRNIVVQWKSGGITISKMITASELRRYMKSHKDPDEQIEYRECIFQGKERLTSIELNERGEL